jgi:peptidoglycan/xylan/chitin deacetylase (PgdA/CDA1 family)
MRNFLQQAVFAAIILSVFGGFYLLVSYERKSHPGEISAGTAGEASGTGQLAYIQSSSTSSPAAAPHALPLSSQITETSPLVIDLPSLQEQKIQQARNAASQSKAPPQPKLTTDPRAYSYPPSVGVPLTQKVTGPAPQGTAASVPVFLYHGEGNIDGKTPIESFISQMQSLKRAGWNTITLEQFRAFMKDGTPVPDKSFLLTFDDGRKDSYYPVDPVLKQLDYTAVMFVITGFSMPDNGKTSDFYLSKDELLQMQQSGRWEIESHGKEDHRQYVVTAAPGKGIATTTGHFLSNLFTVPGTGQLESEQDYRQRITTDLTLAKQRLEQDFNKPIIAFAYPFNDFGQDTENFPGAKNIIAEIVPNLYTFSFYQTWPGEGEMFNSPDPNAYMVRRIEPNAQWTGQQLLDLLNSARARSLPYSQSDTFDSEWSGAWGTIHGGPALALAASSDSTGASAVLKGTSGWKDYSLSADVSWNSGSEASLIARKHDATHYLTCDFSQGTIYIEEHTDGKQSVIAKAKYAVPQSTQDVQLGMTVSGNAITCSLGGQPLVSGLTSNPILSSGGIGFQVWNPSLGAAEMQVKDVEVTQ